MDHNKERFAKDSEAVKMYRLVTDFFLKELKLDFVTQEEIEHMIGAFHKQQYLNKQKFITNANHHFKCQTTLLAHLIKQLMK